MQRLRQLSHDIVTAQEAGQANQGIEDNAVLAYASEQGRAVLTFNRRHLIRLHSMVVDSRRGRYRQMGRSFLRRPVWPSGFRSGRHDHADIGTATNHWLVQTDPHMSFATILKFPTICDMARPRAQATLTAGAQ